MSKFASWAAESALAREIPVPTKIILLNTESSMEKLRNKQETGIRIPQELLKQKAPFALEAGGHIIGWGNIVKKGTRHYFKLRKIEEA